VEMTENEKEIYYLGLLVKVSALRWRGDPDEDGYTCQLDRLWLEGVLEDERDWQDGCRWIASCVAQWPKEEAPSDE